MHVSLSDATGDSAVIEFVDGEMRIWHDRSYQVMTNEPTYDRQLAVLEYWQNVNPREFLPGTVRASDRFVRAHFYINAVTQSADPRIAAASVFSVIREASVVGRRVGGIRTSRALRLPAGRLSGEEAQP